MAFSKSLIPLTRVNGSLTELLREKVIFGNMRWCIKTSFYLNYLHQKRFSLLKKIMSI